MPSYTRAPIVRIEQLIRASPRTVFNAFTRPAILKKFWLSKASAPLEEHKTVRWEFMVRGASDRVKVLAHEQDTRIRVQWSDRTETEWNFTAIGRNKTLVRIEQSGFSGSGDAIVSAAIDTAQGFAFVLSDLKVLLERRIRSGIVRDKAAVIERSMRMT